MPSFPCCRAAMRSLISKAWRAASRRPGPGRARGLHQSYDRQRLLAFGSLSRERVTVAYLGASVVLMVPDTHWDAVADRLGPSAWSCCMWAARFTQADRMLLQIVRGAGPSPGRAASARGILHAAPGRAAPGSLAWPTRSCICISRRQSWRLSIAARRCVPSGGRLRPSGGRGDGVRHAVLASAIASLIEVGGPMMATAP